MKQVFAAVSLVFLLILVLLGDQGLHSYADGAMVVDADFKDFVSKYLISHRGDELSSFDDAGNDTSEEPTFVDFVAEEEEDSWSIVWYIASFSGLILFFLIVSCSEWCCRSYVRPSSSHSAALHSAHPMSASSVPTVQETQPPPAYDLFAPPSYESLTGCGSQSRANEKSEYDVYVVPVHAMRMLQQQNTNSLEDEPPSYTAISFAESQRQRSS